MTSPIVPDTVVGIIGQSNVNRWKTDGQDLVASSEVSLFNGSTFNGLSTTGNGQISFGNDLTSLQGGDSIGMINGAVSGSALLSKAVGTNGYWLDFNTANEPYSDFIQQVTSSGRSLDALIWCQGEREIYELSQGTSITQLEYSDGLTDLIAEIRSDLNLPNLPVVIMQTGVVTQGSPTAGQQQLIRDAQSDVAAAVANVSIVTGNTDIPLKDGFHYTDAGYITHGSRAATEVNNVL